MKERRKSTLDRLDINLSGQFFLKDTQGDRKEWTIIDISRGGAGLVFYTAEKINIGATIVLEIIVPKTTEPTNVEGIVRWIKQDKGDFFVGIEAASKLDENKFEGIFISALDL